MNDSYYDGSFLLSPSTSNSIMMNNFRLLQTMIPEEISTLFVVGFPENMQEREFQNMFVFSPGFEAATLKIPGTMTTLIEEDNRKQIIGFVKFRTRLDALDAKEILNGKMIDHEKGSVLKAEMAKKNFHTKKELQQQLSQQQQRQQLPQQQLVTHQQQYIPQQQHTPPEQQTPPLQRTPPPQQKSPLQHIPPQYRLHQHQQQQTIKTPYEAFYSVKTKFLPSSPPDQHQIIPNCTKSSSFLHYQHNNNSNNNRYSSSKIIPDQIVLGIMGNTKASTVPLTSTLSSSSLASSSSPFTEHPFLLSKVYKTISPPPQEEDDCQFILSPSSTPILANHLKYYRIDQNPPCNTLYVGNLPMSTSQEELRSMFSKCPGYKRLSFKAKPNGPMCFIEFDDIPYATLALQAMHGKQLNNSDKGIRLSYSKNPLLRFTPITR